ncbi:MAG TPA: hypothetical protein EYN67_00015 [Flavobacteriales bacterium]|nr:hypothetical protein [Flavobacteriales bacterium]
MEKSESIKNIAVAMCEVQASMESASKSSDNPFFNSKYADLSEVLRCIKGIIPSKNLSFMQMPSFESGVVSVETIVMHSTGEWISSTSASPISKSNPQGVGDAITYLRRYSLAAIFGLAQQDDDGNSNSEQPSKNKSSQNQQQGQDDNKPWYNEPDYQADLQGITHAIKEGTPPDDVIKQISQKFKVANKYRDLIKAI